LTDWEHEIVKLPTSKGGLRITNPSECSLEVHRISVEGTKVVVKAIIDGTKVLVDEHNDLLHKVKTNSKVEKQENDLEKAQHIVSSLSKRPQRLLSQVLKENTSGWLNMGLSQIECFDLSAEMFRDRWIPAQYILVQYPRTVHIEFGPPSWYLYELGPHS